MFKGSLVALITPMRPDGTLDEAALARFVDWQISEGTHGVVPVGTTGESPTLSHEEHKRVVEITVEVARGRVPVIAGAGSNSTAEAIDLTRHATRAGADAVLIVTPYYNKPTQEGLFLHFSAIADASDIPIIIYNIPGRSVIDMSVETMARLARHKNIVGVKDATANLARPLHTTRACGEAFCQLSGEDHTAVAFLAAGGDRLHQRHRQRRPAAVQRHAHRLAGRPRRRGDAHPEPAGAAARRDVRRNLARSREIRRLPPRPHQRALPPAAGPLRRGDEGAGAGRDGRGRPAQLSPRWPSAASRA